MINRKLCITALIIALVSAMTAAGCSKSKAGGKTADSKTGGKTANSKTDNGNSGGWTDAGRIFSNSDTIYALAYGKDKFVASGGIFGQIATSTDGSEWTTINIGNVGITAIAYGKNKFVAGGADDSLVINEENRGIITSTDGVTWKQIEDSKINFGIFAITFGKDKFVAGGENGKMAYSPDGLKWTAVKDSTLGAINIIAIAYGGNRFVALGNDDSDNCKMASSKDGVTWTAVNDSKLGKSLIKTIAYGKDRFIAGNLKGEIAISKDGVKWTAADAIGFGVTSIIWDNNKFVAVGNEIGDRYNHNFKMATSKDGAKWTTVTDSTIDNYIVWVIAADGKGMFVAGGEGGRIWYLTGK